MRESITPDVYANQIRMQRTAHFGAILIVEGSSDAILYRRMIDESACQLVGMGNKDMTLKVLTILNQEHFAGLVAIVDKDFDELEGRLPQMSNLFFTDTHDLETLLLKSPALETVLAEFASEQKKRGLDVRKMLLEAGSPIGYLVWISLQDQLDLKFATIDYGKFLDEFLKINQLKLIREVKNKSQRLDLPDLDLQQRLAKQQNSQHDPWQVCRGHDLTAILSYGLRKILGSHKPADVTPEVIERSLRLAYESTYFSQTRLYSAIKGWENQQANFIVLK